jgi:hypothetical protein
MYLCILNQDEEILEHRNMKAAPEPFLKAIAPYREDLVVCVECIFPSQEQRSIWERDNPATLSGSLPLHGRAAA